MPSCLKNKMMAARTKRALKGVIIAVIFLALWSMNSPSVHSKLTTVNAIIGDESFVVRFGDQPNDSTDEMLRIQTHLEYVENLLRERTVVIKDPDTREQRLRYLQLLRNYRIAGVFPQNLNFPNQRRPCFEDQNGNICAVGYLIEQSGHRPVIDEIKAKYNDNYIDEMDIEALNVWQQQSGFTGEELAMIQPTYARDLEEERFRGEWPSANERKSFRQAEVVTLSFNAGLIGLNALAIKSGRPHQIVPVLGVMGGCVGIGLGLNGRASYKAVDLVFGGLSMASGLIKAVVQDRQAKSEKQGKKGASKVPTVSFLPPLNQGEGTNLNLVWRF